MVKNTPAKKHVFKPWAYYIEERIIYMYPYAAWPCHYLDRSTRVQLQNRVIVGLT